MPENQGNLGTCPVFYLARYGGARGGAFPSHGRGRRFDPCSAHQFSSTYRQFPAVAGRTLRKHAAATRGERVEYVRPMSCKRRVAKVTGLPWAEGAEKNRRPSSRAPAMSWYGEAWTNALEAVPKVFLSRCHHSRRPAGTRRLEKPTDRPIRSIVPSLLRKLRIDKPGLSNR